MAVLWLMAIPVPGKAFWPYFAGAAILLVWLVRRIRAGETQSQAADRAVAFGPLFFAIPIAVFGADHFVATKIVVSVIPSWIPWHLFWAYFVGVALFAAALSLVTQKHSVLAATLLSAMLFSFVLLIHVPAFARHPHNRFALVVLLRDSSFSVGALACALAQADGWARASVRRLTVLTRSVIGVTTVVFGVEHFLFPEFVPVVPLELPMRAWIPLHLFLSYIIGVALIACGLSIVFHWRARQAATWLGIVVFAAVLAVYLPITVAKISNTDDGLNYFADTLMFGGSALLLAGALPRTEHGALRAENLGESPASAGAH